MNKTIILAFLIILLANFTLATDVAYVLRILSSPDYNIISVITGLNLTYTLIDDSDVAGTDFSDYRFILTKDNIANLPANSYKSIVLNTAYRDGWSNSDGSKAGSQPLWANNSNTNISITENMTGQFQVYTSCCDSPGVSLQMHYLGGRKYDITSITTAVNNAGEYILAKKENPRRVFFGIDETDYWTSTSRKLFENSMRWLLTGDDGDGDGFTYDFDCNDNNAGINPNATEIIYDGIDQNCDGYDIGDVDLDGYCNLGYFIQNKMLQCSKEPGNTGTDCNDNDAGINPNATEIPYDGINQNCRDEPAIFNGPIANLQWNEDDSGVHAINLSSYFASIDGNQLNFEVHQTSSNQGINVYIQNEIAYFESEANWNGNDWIVFKAVNTIGQITPTNNITLIVNPINDAPVLNVASELYFTEGSLVKINPSASDADEDNITLGFSAPFNSSGEWQTIVGNAGEYNVIITASDGKGGSSSKSVLVHVIPNIVINEMELSSTTGEKWVELYNPGNVSINISHFQIRDGISKNIIHIIPAGIILNSHDYYISYISELNSSQSLELRDSQGNLILDITPVLSDDSNNEESWQRMPNGQDSDNYSDWVKQKATKEMSNEEDVIAPVVSLISPANGAVIKENNVTFNYTAIDNKAGSLNCTFYLYLTNETQTINQTIANGSIGSFYANGIENGNYTWNVECSDGITSVINQNNWSFSIDKEYPPVVLANNATAEENSEVIINVNATDANNDVLTYSINDSRFTQNGNIFRWQTGYNDAGIYYVKVHVFDGTFISEKEVRIEVLNKNRAPVFSGNMPDVSMNEDGKIELSLEDYFSDPDGDSLVYLVNSTHFDIEEDEVLAPSRNWNGQETIIITASDGNLSVSGNSFNVIVSPVNDGPELGISSGSIVCNSGNGDIAVDYERQHSTGATINLTSCQNLTSANSVYKLNENIHYSSGWACFDIQADNITLDCDGHRIIGLGRNNEVYGVLTSFVKNATIRNCRVRDFDTGIYLWGTNSSNINGNELEDNKAGIQLTGYSDSNIVYNNNLKDNEFAGIAFLYSRNNIISSNKIENNGYLGIYFIDLYSRDNVIYNNYFRNTYNVGPIGVSANSYNTTLTAGMNIMGGNLMGGNYWADYNGTGFSETCSDAENDGICDSVYTIDSRNVDNLPLREKDNCEINGGEGEIVELVGNGEDIDSANLSYSINDSRFIQNGNIFRWTPDYDDAGIYYFEIRVSDGVFSDSIDARLNIIDRNEPPQIDLNNISINEDSGINQISINARDSDGNITDLRIIEQDINKVRCSVNFTEGKIIVEPAKDFYGTGDNAAYCTIQARDDDNGIRNKQIKIEVKNVNDAPVITESYPGFNPILAVNGNQMFSITMRDIDSPMNELSIEWRVDNIKVDGQSNNLFNYQAAGTGTHEIKAIVKDLENSTEIKWDVMISNTPIAYDYNGETTNFAGITDLSNVNLILEKINIGKIVFLSSVDLRGRVDFNHYSGILSNIAAIDSLYFTGLLNKPAIVTFYNINSEKTPSIYYNSEFSMNASSISSLCPKDKCYNISYNNGVFSFITSGFSSFRVGDTLSCSEYSGKVCRENQICSGETREAIDGTCCLSECEPVLSDAETCENITGELDIEIRSPDEGEEFEIGESVEVKLRIENNADEDLDVEVFASLYDVTNDEEVESDSEGVSIESGDKEDVELSIPITDIDDENEYVVYVRAEGEDGIDYCNQKYREIKIQRKKYDVQIKRFDVPETVNCGEIAEARVSIENLGKRDEDVILSVDNSELKIHAVSQEINLEKYDEDNSAETSFIMIIPEDAESREYTIEAKAKYSKESSASRQIKVTCQKKQTISIENVPSVKLNGGSSSTVSNAGSEIKTMTIINILLIGGIIAILVLIFRLRRR